MVVKSATVFCMFESKEFIDALYRISPVLVDWYKEQVNFNRAVHRHCRALEKALKEKDKPMFEVYRKERIRLFHLEREMEL